MITIRIKNRDLDFANKSGCDPTYTSLARYLNTSWRAIEYKNDTIQVFSEDDELEGIYTLSKDDLELLKEVRKEWEENRSYFFSDDYEVIRFHIKKEKHVS